MSFELQKLGYPYQALEPIFDGRTMEIHHSKHHAAYTTNLNAALEGSELEGKTIEEILAHCADKPAVRNNAGGYYNHHLFWEILTPGGSSLPSGALAKAIEQEWGSFENFKVEFSKVAMARFGSGWAWLGVKEGKLCICSTPNQDNPLMNIEGCGCTPILGLDVWEHAYYLHFQNRRADYITAFFQLVNWDKVAQRYQKCIE